MKGKVISLTQPYATCCVLGIKTRETRSWSTKHRGPLFIHASKGFPAWAKNVAKSLFDVPEIREKLAANGIKSVADFPIGKIIGGVDLLSCHKVVDRGLRFAVLSDGTEVTGNEFQLGDYSTDKRRAWKLANPRELVVPIPAKGQLQIWEYDFVQEPVFENEGDE